MHGDRLNIVATEEDLNVGFNFVFDIVVEHQQRMGQTQYDTTKEMENKMTRF
jgi:hypothetical protein